MMNIELVPATIPQHDTLLRNLWQFYMYDFSRFMTDWRLTSGGRFFETDLDGVWSRPYRQVFILQVLNDIAGFTIADVKRHSYLTDDPEVNYLAEFCVLAPFQGKGIGAAAATQLFDRFRGRWEVFEMEENRPAQAFWRKVIGRYMKGDYREMISKDHHGIVQLFDNSVQA
jgi:predicted acetyltransferase